MVIFDNRLSNKKIKGMLYLHGMDLILLVDLYGEKLKDYLAQDFSQYIFQEADTIKSTDRKDMKEQLLRTQHSFGLEKTNIDEKFFDLLAQLLEQDILFSKDKLEVLTSEEIDTRLQNISKSENSNAQSKQTEYERLSLEFAKSILKLIKDKERLQEEDYSGNGNRIIEILNLLTSYGLDKKGSLLDNTKKSPIEVLTN